jgi:Protein of unknown function (DUF3887)
MIPIAIAALASLTLTAAPAHAASARPLPVPATLAGPTSPVERGQAFIQVLAGRRFEEAVTWFNERMRSKVSAAHIGASWDGLLAQHGAFTSSANGEVEEKDGIRIVRLTLAFDRATVRATVAFDAQDKVSGVWFRDAAP